MRHRPQVFLKRVFDKDGNLPMRKTFKQLVLLAAVFALPAVSGCSSWRSWQAYPDSKSKASIAPKPQGLFGAKPDTRQAQIDLLIASAEQAEAKREDPEAMKKYQEVLAMDRKNAMAHHRLALISIRLSASEQAKKHFETALELSPSDDSILADYAYWHYLSGRNQDAMHWVDQGLKKSPHFQRYHNIKGLAQARERQFEPAVASFLASGCNQQEAWANIGHVLLLDGDVQSAEYWIGHAAQSDQGSQVAKKTHKVIQASYESTQPQAPIAR